MSELTLLESVDGEGDGEEEEDEDGEVVNNEEEGTVYNTLYHTCISIIIFTRIFSCLFVVVLKMLKRKRRRNRCYLIPQSLYHMWEEAGTYIHMYSQHINVQSLGVYIV